MNRRFPLIPSAGIDSYHNQKLILISKSRVFGLRTSIPCDMIQVGYRDALGNDRADIENEILKTNLDVNGNPIGKTDKSQVFS